MLEIKAWMRAKLGTGLHPGTTEEHGDTSNTSHAHSSKISVPYSLSNLCTYLSVRAEVFRAE